MLWLKRIFCFYFVVILHSFSWAEWITFEHSSEIQKPTARVIISNDRETVIEFSITGMEVKEIIVGQEKFHVLRFPDYYTTMEIGKPQLPVISELIGIPDFSNVNVSVIDIEQITLDGYNVYPYQRTYSENDDKEFIIDRDFYEKDIFYPELDVGNSEPRIWRDTRITTLKVYPVKYNPASGVIKISRRIVIRLEYSGISDTNVFDKSRKPIQPEWVKIYENTILNYEYLGYERLDNRMSKITSQDDYKFLILTVDRFYDNIQPLAKWKIKKGLKTKVYTLTEATGQQNPSPETIKDFIEYEYYNYDDEQISYVLLVGDPDELELYKGFVPTIGEYWGDYWYSDLEGAYPSEPELAIGRFSCNTDDEVDLFVNKILTYELQPPFTYIGGDIWLNRSLLIAEDDAEPEDDTPGELLVTYQECKAEIKSNHQNELEIITAYGGWDWPDATNEYVMDRINEGIGIVNFRGHGDFYKWSAWNELDEDFTTDTAKALTNNIRTPVVFSICCLSADLHTSAETLAEAFCKHESGGAVAFLGATDYSRSYANHFYDEKLYDALCTQGISKIGEISNYAVVQMLTNYSTERYTEAEARWNARIYLWLGDPTMEAWADEPQQFTGVTFYDNGTNITVDPPVKCDIYVYNGTDDPEVYLDRDDLTFIPSVRPVYITLIKDGYIPCTAVSGGTFTSDQYWFGDLYVLRSILVDNNSTLNILPGTDVKLYGYHNFSVIEGSKIIAKGTSQKPVTFTSATGTSRQSWGCVYVYSNDNVFEHCHFEYGNYAILINARSGTIGDNIIKDCTFYQNDQALRIHKNSLTTVQGCEIYNNRHALVFYQNPSIDFQGNHIHHNDRDGIYSWSYNHHNLYGNVIEYNGLGSSSTRNGIYASNDDYIYLEDYNTVRENNVHEIQSYYGTDLVQAYSSSIHDDTGYEIYNTSGNTVLTFYCWWGDSWDYYGPVYFHAPQYGVPSWDGQTRTRGTSKINGSPIEDDKERIVELKKIIHDYPDTKEGVDAFRELYIIIRRDFCLDLLGEKKKFFGYMEHIYAKYADLELGKLVLEKMIAWQSLLGNTYEAIALSNEALEVFSGNELFNIQAGLAMLHIYNDDPSSAKKYLNTCEAASFRDESVVEFIKEELADYEYRIANGLIEPIGMQKPSPEIQSGDGLDTPESFNLSQNYPNPGNPTTTIQFALPESGHVLLKVMNVLGQEVKRLVDEQRDSGYHSVVWDGKDHHNLEVPSGLYLYTLQVGDKVFTKKLMLMK